MASVQHPYAAATLDATGAYLAAVRECLTVLPAAMQDYGSSAFAERVDAIADRESTCDELLCRVRTQCGDADPNFTDVYLHTDDVLELFALIDTIPNAAERFVTELQTAAPSLCPPTREDLAGMAAIALRSTVVLTNVVEEFVGALLASGSSGNPTEEVDLVAGLEGRADDLKLRIQRRVFEAGPTAHALVVRDLARVLDSTVDAAEDAADHLLFVHSARR